MMILLRLFKLLLTSLRFTYTVLVHKYCILITGLQLNRRLKCAQLRISISRLLKHDLSKFSRSEFWPYACYYYGQKDQEKFDFAWLHHLRANDHHWEHYIENYSVGMQLLGVQCREMKNEAILEMVVDWLSAERAYNGTWPIPGKWTWAQKSIKNIGLHPDSKQKFIALLSFLGFSTDVQEKLDGKDNVQKLLQVFQGKNK